MSLNAKILAVATAVPEHEVLQSDVAAAAAEVFADRFRGYERMAMVFGTAGIRKRNFVKPLAWFKGNRGWAERNSAYLEGANALFVESATKALAAANLTAGDVDMIVTASSTGIATPSIEARVAGRMGFRCDVERFPVFGLGCAAGVAGLALAGRLCAGRDGSVVLFVAVEACSLAYRPDDLSKASIVATALFGDGAAACVLRNGAEGLADIEFSGQHMWPDTIDIMGWRIEEEGLGVIFDRSIPPFAEQHMASAVAEMLARGNLRIGDVDRFICHPGGTKVVEALERGLSLPAGTLSIERTILAEHGNMSGPTVFFVLEKLLAEELPARSALLALGPGFTAGILTLTRH